MAQSVESVLPRIRSLAKRYAGKAVSAEDLESVGALAFLEAEQRWDGTGSKEAFALERVRLRMLDAVRDALRYVSTRVLYDALSTTATLCMLRRHSSGGAALGVQDESAYVSEVVQRIKADALGKMLFVESLSGKVSLLDRAKRSRRRIAVRTERRMMAESLKKALESAQSLVEEP